MEGNEVIFLDEPSTGMDPNARRKLWAVIKEETILKNKVRYHFYLIIKSIYKNYDLVCSGAPIDDTFDG